jgi:hypothetical protein
MIQAVASKRATAAPRHYQFTLTQLVRCVFIAAGVCMVLRGSYVLLLVGVALLSWGFAAVVVGQGWGQVWDTRFGRWLLVGLLIVIAIPFSPFLLLSLDTNQWRRS